MTAPTESLFERYKNEVRLLVSLRDLVEANNPKGLRSTGKSSILCCSPLRADRHPSFSVFESGGEYIAFDHAIRESFDLFAYVEKKEGLSFADAVKWCGDRAGRPWDEYKKQHSGEVAGGRAPPPPGFTQDEWDRAYEATLALDERQLVANVQQAMVDLCHAMFLRTSLPKYVEERWGITPETQKRFLLGFVPHGFAGLLDSLRDEGVFPYARKQLAKTGWFTFRQRFSGDPDPELRCLFDGRLLYPYLFRGKCRYACARIIHEDRIDRSYFDAHPWDESKFKKALVAGRSHPSVSQYVQNDLLYNADNAARSRTAFARLVIVEGPSDCMAMVEAGYDCVAPVATSIRSEDVPMLLEAAAPYKEVVLATDTDVKPDGRRPGLEGALRMAPELLKAGKRVKLLVFPLPKGANKVDPASWALEYKRAGQDGDPFTELMAKAPTVAGALVGFLPTEIAAAQLPEALSEIVSFARAANASRAEIEEIARLVKDRLRSNFTRAAIRQAMGAADERIEAESRTEAAAQAVDDASTLDIEGRVIERGGHDQPGKMRCYQTFGKDGAPIIISTFILQPSRIIITAAGDRLLEVSVHIETGTQLIERWVVPKGAWTSRRAFVGTFPHERMQFNGSDFNVHAVYQIVSERAARLGVRSVRGEGVIGLHRTTAGPRLVLPTETWDANGVMADPDVVYSSDNGMVPFSAMLRVDGAQEPRAVDAMVERLLALLFKLNDPIKLTTICAWVIGCYFLPEIRECNGGKASILNVYGTQGSSKCLAPGTLVLKFDGTIVPVESLVMGDELMGPDSLPRRVLSLDIGFGPMRRIVPTKGDPWECNHIHVLTLVHSDTDTVRDITVDEWESMKPWRQSRWKLFIPETIDFPTGETKLPIDPYFVGLWIGDGTKEQISDGRIRAVAITKPDRAIVEACESMAATYGLRVRSRYRTSGNPTHHINRQNGRGIPNELLEDLRSLWPNGYDGSIPYHYLHASRADRMKLLAGILDTDGCLTGGYFSITQKNRRTSDDLAFLARSLGFRVTERDIFAEGTEYRSAPSDRTTTYRSINILGDCSSIPTRITRKRASPRRQIKNARRTGFIVKKVENGPFFGFELDGDGRFLLGDFTVTHNTTLMKEIVHKTLQPYGPTFNPATPAETRFATIRNLSWSNVFVSAFDEYKVDEAGNDFIRLLRTGFSGGAEMRGNRDQSVRGYDLHGAVALFGEQRADVDAAMGERLMMVALDRTTIETRNADVVVHEILDTDERWRVATDILQWRMRIDVATVRMWWTESRRTAYEALDWMKLKVPSRTRDLCAELSFRLRIWTEWLGHRGAARRVDVPTPPLPAILRQLLETATGVELPADSDTSKVVVSIATKSLVVRALEDITPYASSGTFEDRKCYRLAIRNGRRMLVVHPGSLAAAIAREARSRGAPDPTNGERALKQAAKEEHARSGADGWLVDPEFRYRMGSADEVGKDEERTVRMRCWLIDIDRAAEVVGLELDWPGTPATWGGDRKKVLPLPPWRKGSSEV